MPRLLQPPRLFPWALRCMPAPLFLTPTPNHSLTHTTTLTSIFLFLQISDKERKVELDTLFRDVASVLSEKCINPESSRPYTISMLERALKDSHFSVDPKRPAKAQAMEVRRRGGGKGGGGGQMVSKVKSQRPSVNGQRSKGSWDGLPVWLTRGGWVLVVGSWVLVLVAARAQLAPAEGCQGLSVPC